jgi:phosphonopyruvate decarboxylase
MVSPKFLLDQFLHLGIEFYTGVPDSLMKNFLLYLDTQDEPVVHIPAANEGGAIALAVGHYLATEKCPMVYMQNSGLGNAVNPLLSLADPEVYSIPLVLLIGWRGEPGVKDEPQHVKQGKVTLDLLETMEIPYEILPASEDEVAGAVRRCYDKALAASAPAALIAKKSVFGELPGGKKSAPPYTMLREDALKTVVDALEKEAIVLSTTGKLSRELYEYRKASASNRVDFITVGSMGHVSQIALGVARGRPERLVYCLDGDGSAIMHMGGLTVTGTSDLANFKHIIFNNGVHESVGGQTTRGFEIDLRAIARASNYRDTLYAETESQLAEEIERLKRLRGPAMLEIRIKPGARKDLGRPTEKMTEIKKRFMDQL